METRTFTRGGVLTACVAFLLIGALQALYGPALAAIQQRYGVDTSTAGLTLSAHFVGGIAGVLLFDRLHHRLTGRQLLGVSLGLMALGAAGFGAFAGWPLALGSVLVAGLGFGGIDYGLNQLFATGFGRRSPAMLNVLNAHFCVGAVGGPFLIAVLGADAFPAIFLGVAALSALLLAGLRGTPGSTSEPPAPAATGTTRRKTLILAAFVTLYVCNVGVETGVGGWEPTHLVALGHSASGAAAATSGYWLAMTLGRFLAVPLTLRFSDRAIVLGCCVGVAGCLLLTALPALAAVGYAGAGLFLGPIFPTGLPWLAREVPESRRATAFVIASAMIGGVAFPPLLGAGIEWAGVHSVPIVLSVVNLGCLALAWWLVRRRTTASRRRSGVAAGSRSG